MVQYCTHEIAPLEVRLDRRFLWMLPRAKIMELVVKQVKPEFSKRQKRLYMWRGFGLCLVFAFIVTTSFLPFATLSKASAQQAPLASPTSQVPVSIWDGVEVTAMPTPVLASLEIASPVAQERAVPNPPVQKTVRLLFGGDVNEGRWGDNPAWHLPLVESFTHLLPLFRSVDLVFFNAEGGLCDPVEDEVEIQPRGRDVLWVKPSSLIELRSVVKNAALVVDQANNHSMNLGDACRRHGQDLLEAAEVGVIGIGANLAEARRPYVIEINQTVIAILAYTDTDVIIDAWVANRDQPGVAPMDTTYLVQDLKAVRPDVDFLIVTMHSGTQYDESVSKMQTEFALMAIRNGADLVIGHGPHIPQGRMDIDGKPIYFSLGNGMMDQCFSKRDAHFWADVRKNLWLEVEIQGSKLVDTKHHVFYSEKCLEPNKASQDITSEVEQTLLNVSFQGDWPWLFPVSFLDQQVGPRFELIGD